VSYDYAALRDGTVAALMAKYGVAAVLVRWTKGAYNKGTASFGAGSTTNNDVTIVIDEFRIDEVDGTLVRREDKKFIMGGADTEPIMNDKIKIGSDQWEVLNVTPIKPGGVTVAYIIQARR
jgi:hypothetical protein